MLLQHCRPGRRISEGRKVVQKLLIKALLRSDGQHAPVAVENLNVALVCPKQFHNCPQHFTKTLFQTASLPKAQAAFIQFCKSFCFFGQLLVSSQKGGFSIFFLCDVPDYGNPPIRFSLDVERRRISGLHPSFTDACKCDLRLISRCPTSALTRPSHRPRVC